MKKNLVKLGISFLLCSSLHAFDYDIVPGKQILGAVNDINDLSVFNKSSVDYIYQPDYSDPSRTAYKYYEVNGTFFDKTNGSVLTKFKKGEGFILEANSTDKISDRASTPIIFNNMTYYTVYSPATKRVWLDRNIGASAVCTKIRSDVVNPDSSSLEQSAEYTKSQSFCFGNYFQWGRGADGHESKYSTTTNTIANNFKNPGKKFITAYYDWTSQDTTGNMRSAIWAQTNGKSICPKGFRVPYIAELAAESKADLINILKFPMAGKRYNTSGDPLFGGYGYYWSLNPGTGPEARYANYLLFNSTYIDTRTYDKTSGFSVRCIQDN